MIESVQNIKEEIYNTCMVKDDCISIMAVTEYNDPNYFNKMVNN